jgi:hypothetical protein
VVLQFDIDNFQEKYADLKWAEGKRKQRLEIEAIGKLKDAVPPPPIQYKVLFMNCSLLKVVLMF